LVTFIVSGIMHEMLVNHLCGTWRSMTGEPFLYFALQGPLCLLEDMVLGQLCSGAEHRGHLLRSRWVRLPLTWAVMLPMAKVLYWPPFQRNGVMEMVWDSPK